MTQKDLEACVSNLKELSAVDRHFVTHLQTKKPKSARLSDWFWIQSWDKGDFDSTKKRGEWLQLWRTDFKKRYVQRLSVKQAK